MEKARQFQENICKRFIDYAKALHYTGHRKLWKILQGMGIPDPLTCILRNLYAGQEATIRTRHGTMDRFQIRKGVHQGYILSPYAEYIIMGNARLDEAQAGSSHLMRTISHLRYADDTTLMAESEEKLKSLLKKVEFFLPYGFCPPDVGPAFRETCMHVRKQQLELDMEQQIGSK